MGVMSLLSLSWVIIKLLNTWALLRYRQLTMVALPAWIRWSVIFIQSSMSKIVDPGTLLRTDTTRVTGQYWLPIPLDTFCSKLTESVRIKQVLPCDSVLYISENPSVQNLVQLANLCPPACSEIISVDCCGMCVSLHACLCVCVTCLTLWLPVVWFACNHLFFFHLWCLSTIFLFFLGDTCNFCFSSVVPFYSLSFLSWRCLMKLCCSRSMQKENESFLNSWQMSPSVCQYHVRPDDDISQQGAYGGEPVTGGSKAGQCRHRAAGQGVKEKCGEKWIGCHENIKRWKYTKQLNAYVWNPSAHCCVGRGGGGCLHRRWGWK